MSATLEDLIQVRSQLADAQYEYLDKVENALAENALLNRFERSLDEVRIPLRVVPFQPEKHREEAPHTEHFRPTGMTRDDEEEPDKKRYGQRGMSDEKERHHPPQPLATLAPLLRYAVMTADPGGGKTEWLKNFARQQAIASKQALKDQTIAAADVVLPVYLRLPEISKALGAEGERKEVLREFLVQRGCLAASEVWSEAQRVAAAMLWALVERRLLPERLVPFVWRQWFATTTPAKLTERPLLCLDAWDEVRKDRELLARYLKAFAADSACRIFLTSRIVGYDLRPLPVESIATGTQRELRICAFEWNDTEQFVTSWFRAPPEERGGQMIAELRQKIAVFGMAANPLMATLLCMAYSPDTRRDPLPFPLRRGPVYQRVLQGLLGEWPRQRGEEVIEPRKLTEEEKKRMEAKLDLLAEVALHFFLRGEERFSRTALEAALTTYLATKPGKRFQIKEAMRWLQALTQEQRDYYALLDEDEKRDWVRDEVIAALCHELIEQDGLLALDMETADETWYGFLHLTFHEYLTACALARREWQAIESLVDKKAWLPEWEETLILLAGMREPMELLKLLIDPARDDLFRHRFCLAARCLPELSQVEQPKSLTSFAEGIVINQQEIRGITEQIADDMLNLWREYQAHNCSFPHINRNLPAIAQSSQTTLLRVMMQHLQDKDDLVRNQAVAAFRQMGAAAANAEILTALVQMVLHGVDNEVCSSAVNLLGHLGAAAAREEVLTALIQVIQHHANDEVRCSSAIALGKIGGAAAKEDILQYCGHFSNR